MKKQIFLLLFFLVLMPCLAQAQDTLATVYFYRDGKFAGSFVGYDVWHNGAVIGRIKSNSVVAYRCQPGPQTFKAATEGETSIKLDIRAGQTYFIECGVAIGALVGRPVFRQAFSTEARKAISEIDAAAANSIPSSVVETTHPTDTVRALHNLFQRKRRGGTARAVVFGGLGLISLIGTVTYQPTTVNINQGSAGTQTIQLDSGPPVGNYVFIGFSVIMVITGVTQTSKYSAENLNLLLDTYKQGNPLEAIIKEKLKKKDFR